MRERTFKSLLAATFVAAGGGLAVQAVDYTGTDYEPWSYSAGCVVWRATSGQLFHASTVADVAADGTIGATYDLNTSGHPWQVFASNQSAYTSPGTVLVFDEAGYNNNSDAQFAPFSFGGLWVKALQAENTPYCITDTKTDGTDRKVELGATGASTYFKFDESFTFNRNTATKVLGTATVEIAEGATFTINQRANKGALVESGNTLILKGEGTLAVVGGLTISGTLDLSAATRPTIDGDVALAGTIVLPEGTEVSQESPFIVCSGTLSGVNVSVKIGDAEAVEKSFTAENGAITSFGEPIYIFTENYPTVVPAGVTYTFVGGDSAENTVVVDALDVKGTLKTQGYFSFTNYKSNGSTLDVETGSLTLNPGNYWFNGTLTVEAGATFVNTMVSDAVQYGGSFTANIYGTLDMGATRWSLGSNNTLNFYEGCTVTGSGQSGNGTFDWIENATATMNVYGDVNLAAPIRLRDGATVNMNVDAGANAGLTLADTIGSGKIVKKGAGLINFTTNPPYAITVENGAFTFAVDATPTITYSAKPGTGTTMSMWYATQATWKGTVVLGVLSDPAALPLNTYGNANSKIVLKGTTGSCYLSAGTINPELVIDTDEDNVVEFNNGSSGQVVNFTKISGTGTLKLVGWSGCSGATYNLNTIDNFTGTLAIENAITRNGGGTFTIGIGNIVTTGSTTPGSKVLNLTQTAVDGATGTVVYNTTSAQVNGADAKLAVTAGGVYVAGGAATIGGNTTYYRGSSSAYMAVLGDGSAGDSFTIYDDATYGDLDGFSYDSETKTYTMLQMVAQFTYGVQTTKFATIAAACTAAEAFNPVPTVVLLVAIGEQTVPSGWEYNTPEASETEFGTLTKTTGFDPTTGGTYSSTAATKEAAEAEAKAAVVVPAVAEGTNYADLFDYTATGDAGNWTVTATIKEAVVTTVAKAALGVINGTGTLTVPAGLYYRLTTETELGAGTPGASTQSTGAAVDVTKPGTTQGFIKVELSPSPIQ